MKRNFFLILSVILCVALFLPVTTYAQAYRMSGTDMTITVNDDEWYVFTRDNIKDNPELAELGVSYEDMHSILYDNEAYMDAILFYEDGGYIEFFVRKRPLDTGLVNLSNYKDSEVATFAKEIAKNQNTDNYGVYENAYKFAKLEYFDTTYNYHVCEYITVVNKDDYTLTFQSETEFTEWEYEEIKRIVDSIQFDVDTSLKEKSGSISLIPRVIGGGVAGGIAGLIIGLKNKKKKKVSEEPIVNTPDAE